MRFNQYLTICLLLVISLASVGCGGGSQPASSSPLAQDSQGLAWPPPEGAHAASAYLQTVDGADFIARGGNTAVITPRLVFTGGGNLPWAIYSYGDLDSDNELVSVYAEFTETPNTPGDGTRFYFAIANFETDTWQWIGSPTEASPWICPPVNADFYRDDEGFAYLAVVLHGRGYGQLYSVTFDHEANQGMIDAPENLVADTPAPNQVDLDWDDVAYAEGYNVYRSTDKHFLSQSKVNPEPLTASEFTDTLSTDGNYYFYRVTAVAAQESAHSNTVEVWVFGDDLPAPYNLQVTNRTDDSFTISWDYDGSPYGYKLYIDTVPDFTMYSETMQEHTKGGFASSNLFGGLTQGVTYYVKLCAYDGMTDPCGRMSEEISGACGGSWTWSEAELIGTGQPPVRAVVGDGVIAASYFNGFSVYFAIRDDGTWRVEEALPSTTEYFTDYQDLCYGGGTYLVTSFAHDPGDCWVAEWDSATATGNWTRTRIHGNGSTGLGEHVSGMYVACAASDTELAVAHYYLTTNELMLHTRTINGGSWDAGTVIRDGYTAGCTAANSLAYLDGNLYVLATENLINELYFGDRTGGWAWADIRDASETKLSKHHDLQRFNGEWWSTGYQTSDKDLYLIHGESAPWEYDLEDGLAGIAGNYARLAVEDDEAVVIQKKDGSYYFALYSEDWDWHAISVPGVEDYESDADVVLLEGVPYLVFEDDDTGEIKIAYGIAPEE